VFTRANGYASYSIRNPQAHFLFISHHRAFLSPNRIRTSSTRGGSGPRRRFAFAPRAGQWVGKRLSAAFSRAGGRSGAPAAAALSCASPCAWRVVVGFRRLFRRAVVRHCLPASLPTVPLRAVFGAGSSRAAPPCRRSQRSVFVRSICFCKCILFFVWLLVDFCFCSRCYCFLCALMVTVVGACAAGSSWPLVSNSIPKFYYAKRRFPSHQNVGKCMEY
jgi:hypothetical protein